MGIAKRRGTYEQRRAEAIEKMGRGKSVDAYLLDPEIPSGVATAHLHFGKASFKSGPDNRIAKLGMLPMLAMVACLARH